MSFLENFNTLEKERWGKNPEWIRSFRKTALEEFERIGLPTKKSEEWKYTDITEVNPFIDLVPLSSSPAFLDKTTDALLKLPSCHRLVFVNGLFSPNLSTPLSKNGIEIESLEKALQENNSILKQYLGNTLTSKNNSFASLNSAFTEQGTFIYIPKKTVINEAIYIVYLSTHTKEYVHYPRNLIVLDTDAQVKIIEDYTHTTENKYFTNTLTHIHVQARASCEHYKIERENNNALHIATVEIDQQEYSSFTSHSFSFGAKLTRNTMTSRLNGKGAQCTFLGFYMGSDEQHIDNHTMIVHEKEECTSTEHYHGILDDKAHGVFNGKIYVAQHAQKTNSEQTNRTLLLSNDARMDTKPQLEIFADDVKCTHGATVGKLDETSLYYLRSRGIAEEEAKKILTRAFAENLTSKITIEPLKEHITTLVKNKLHKE